MSRVVVHHFGPDSATVGGMASVIRVFTEHTVGADVVECHASWRPESSSLSATRLLADCSRKILKLAPGDVAHLHLSERGSFVREGSLVALARLRGLRTVITMHGASFMPFAQQHPRLAAGVLRRAHVVTCLDEETLAFVRANAPSVRSVLLPNPIPIDDELLPADHTDELVVFAGEIGLRKGVDVLHSAWLLAAERRPLARCLMIGPVGDYTPPATERLEVRPAVDAHEMKALLRSARVVTLPSRAEGMPMVLTEAMSLGRPFVSTPVGGIPSLAETGGGILVPVGDATGLADSLIELLSDPARAYTIGERGRRFCSETRSVEVIGARLRALYAPADANEHE